MLSNSTVLLNSPSYGRLSTTDPVEAGGPDIRMAVRSTVRCGCLGELVIDCAMWLG